MSFLSSIESPLHVSGYSRALADADAVVDAQADHASSTAQRLLAGAAASAPAPDALFESPCKRELQRAIADAARASNARQALTKLVQSGAKPADIAEAKALTEVADASMHRSLTVLSSPMGKEAAAAALKDGMLRLGDALDRMPEPARAAMLSLPMHSPLSGGAGESYADFWEKIGNAIGGLKEGYLGVYETAVGKNNAFYRDFTTFMTQSAEWTEGDKDITLTLEKTADIPLSAEEIAANDADATRIYNEIQAAKAEGRDESATYAEDWNRSLQELKDRFPKTKEIASGYLGALKSILEKYEPTSDAGIKNGVLVATDTIDKAKKWAKDMGLPDSSVQQNPNDAAQWWVKVDLEPVKNMIASLEALKKNPADKTVTLTPARHGAWKSGFEAQQEQLKTTASTLGQKMAGAQSIYENLIKILTSTIASMLESAKAFLQN